ncbi:MAG: twin-arginine translocation signal domain-containing protein [Opitutales bacterium]|nr:twin-arginine translocation signal domain-containing protein [Opitutales bacterium]
MKNTRRDFLRAAAAGVCVVSCRFPAKVAGGLKELRFGMCADVHKDIMHDADERLGAYLECMTKKDAHFVVQMGDFCQPKKANDSFRAVWQSWEGDQYNVVGNHDMDGGFSREDFRQYLGMEKGYYTYLEQGYRFIVLDGNDRHENAPGGYPRHVGKEQRAWLTETLSSTTEPVVVLVHQSLQNASGVDNGVEVRAILEAANETAGWGRVLACFSGHHHLDDLVEVNGIPYIQVNSMSYYWVGGSKKHESYPTEVHAEHPWIQYTSPYADPLWAFVTIDPKGELRIEGVRSRWVGPSPAELGYEEGKDEQGITPNVAARNVRLQMKESG